MSSLAAPGTAVAVAAATAFVTTIAGTQAAEFTPAHNTPASSITTPADPRP